MRGVRFTKAEAEFVYQRMYDADVEGESTKTRKLAVSVMAKIRALSTPTEPGVNAGELERALVAASRGKVVPVESGFPRISRVATGLGATVAQATVLGTWIAGESWLRGPLTVFTVLNKWPDWLARAKATAPPAGVDSGIGPGDLGPSTTAKRPTSTAGRRTPGLG